MSTTEKTKTPDRETRLARILKPTRRPTNQKKKEPEFYCFDGMLALVDAVHKAAGPEARGALESRLDLWRPEKNDECTEKNDARVSPTFGSAERQLALVCGAPSLAKEWLQHVPDLVVVCGAAAADPQTNKKETEEQKEFALVSLLRLRAKWPVGFFDRVQTRLLAWNCDADKRLPIMHAVQKTRYWHDEKHQRHWVELPLRNPDQNDDADAVMGFGRDLAPTVTALERVPLPDAGLFAPETVKLGILRFHQTERLNWSRRLKGLFPALFEPGALSRADPETRLGAIVQHICVSIDEDASSTETATATKENEKEADEDIKNQKEVGQDKTHPRFVTDGPFRFYVRALSTGALLFDALFSG